jgi:hypothetical protein
MKNVLIAGAIAATLTLAGCHGSAPKKPYVQAPEPEKRSALAAIATAKDANKAAKGSQWRDTGKIIKAAEKLVAEGKFAAAQSEAIKAYYQAKTAQSQAKSQAGTGNPSYIY